MSAGAPLDAAIRDLVERIARGDRRAAARAISVVEDEADGAEALLDAIWPRTGRAHRVGVTGPPGAGKSTLVDAMARVLRQRGRTVGIVAVDPTSPFTGGALLGDRIRMQHVASDPGVFIRSMASRGSLGGIARATADACDVLDAFGKDVVFVETVGVGQTEVDIAQAADTTLVCLSPESGDGVQAMKAGLMEIADAFVVNKADREGALRVAEELKAMLELTPERHAKWTPPVSTAVALRGEGVEALLEALEAHRAYLEREGVRAARRADRLRQKIRTLVDERRRERFWPAREADLERHVAKVLEGLESPFAAARALAAPD